jgi:hypothetical protein
VFLGSDSDALKEQQEFSSIDLLRFSVLASPRKSLKFQIKVVCHGTGELGQTMSACHLCRKCFSTTDTLLVRNAAFCCLVLFASPIKCIRKLVGAVGIENNGVRNFKDLRGMAGNTKSLKKNDEACGGILIAPSKLPHFSPALRFQRRGISADGPKLRAGCGPNFVARMVSRQLYT